MFDGSLYQGCPNYGPRTNCGPALVYYWPAAIIELTRNSVPKIKKYETNVGSLSLTNFISMWLTCIR